VPGIALLRVFDGFVYAGHRGHFGAARHCFPEVFAPIISIASADGPMKVMPHRCTRGANADSRQETIARVQASQPVRRATSINLSIRSNSPGSRRADAIGFRGKTHMRRRAIDFAEYGDVLYAQFAARAQNSHAISPRLAMRIFLNIAASVTCASVACGPWRQRLAKACVSYRSRCTRRGSTLSYDELSFSGILVDGSEFYCGDGIPRSRQIFRQGIIDFRVARHARSSACRG